jgi:biopolymer transport protein ExbD
MIRSDIKTRLKFRRHCQPFRGAFPISAFAAVFLLLLIFLTFDRPFVYLPGIPARLADYSPPLESNQISVLQIIPPSSFRFNGERIQDFESLEKRLRAEVQTNRQLRLLSIQAPPSVEPGLMRKVAEMAVALQLLVDLPGSRIDVPSAQNLALITNRLATVLVNLSGQIYYEHQVVPPEKLKAQLAAAQRQAGRPLTLFVLADKAAPYDVLVKIGDAARLAGIQEMLLATRPEPFIHSRP